MSFKKESLSKQSVKIIFLVFVVLIFVFLGCIVYQKQNVLNVSSIKSSKNISPIKEIDFKLPIRLTIPRIKVAASFESVGLVSDGSMAVPVGPADVAWFNLGPEPGEIGSAVVAGHSGWKNGIPAVFDNLYKLQKGDKIYVENAKGIQTTFIVREIKKYDPKANAQNVFSSSDGQAHLNLVTCTGIWNVINKSRSNRLVVFADKEI